MHILAATQLTSNTSIAAFFETSRVIYIILVALVLLMLWRCTLSATLMCIVGIVMGVLLPAYFSGVTDWTKNFPHAHLGSGYGLGETITFVIIVVLLGVIAWSEHQLKRGRGGEV